MFGDVIFHPGGWAWPRYRDFFQGIWALHWHRLRNLVARTKKKWLVLDSRAHELKKSKCAFT